MLFLTLSSKVKHLDEQVTRLALSSKDLQKDIAEKLATVGHHYSESAGQFSSELSVQIDKTLLAKRNVQKVVTLLEDYTELQEEVEELSESIEKGNSDELADVYRKGKRFVYLRRKLIERIKQGFQGQDLESKLGQIESKFRGVVELQEKFQEILLAKIRQHFILAKTQPVDVVRVMRIVMNDAYINEKAEKRHQEQEHADRVQ